MSSVTDMLRMFQDAEAFKQQLCGPDWVYSTASKYEMFRGSAGSIAEEVCPIASPSAFSPQSKVEILKAIQTVFTLSSTGDPRLSARADWGVGRDTHHGHERNVR